MRSPDAARVRLVRPAELSRRQKEQFIPLCPDFVFEVASPSDELSSLREKMGLKYGSEKFGPTRKRGSTSRRTGFPLSRE